jgi:predicted porin
MKKKLLAAAVTAALGAAPAAQADTANVNVYGKFYPAYVTYSGGEATDGKVATSTPNSNGGGVANKNAIESFNSYVGFRANLDIGGGMKAIMQVEQSVELAGDESDAHWANRNSAAGLEGGFGTVLLGRWDTPFKELHFQSAMFGVSSGSPVSNSNLLSRTPYSDGSSRASFHRRQDNSIQYWSPDFNGIQAKIMYGTEEAEDQANPRDPTRISGSLVYDKGPLLVGVAYEIHDDFRGATAGLGGALASGVDTSKDTGIGFTVGYKIGKTTTIGFDFELLKYENDQGAATAVKDYKRNGWSLAVEQKIGQWTLAANYASAEKGDCSLFGGGACSTSGLEGKQMSFGAKYDLAKNFSIYGWWTKIDNGDSASHSFLDDAPTGADPTAWAVGLLTRF